MKYGYSMRKTIFAAVFAALLSVLPGTVSGTDAVWRSGVMSEGVAAGPVRGPVEDSLVVKERFLPVARRMDRGIDDIKFVYKDEIALGLSISYGTLTSDDSDMMLILDGLNLSGSIFTLNPSFGYFFKDNMCVGVRFGYTVMNGNIGNASLNLGSSNDFGLSLSGVDFRSRMTTMGAFLRSYAGIDSKGHFGLFAELELTYKMGRSHFSYTSGSGQRGTDGNNMQLKAAVNTGVAVYIFPNVCCTLSFGLGGFQFNRVVQHDAEGNVAGMRNASKLLLRLNIADIRIGLNVHL